MGTTHLRRIVVPIVPIIIPATIPIPTIAHNSMILGYPSSMTFDDLSSMTCDDNDNDDDDDMRMSIGTIWDKLAALGEDKIATGSRKENNDNEDDDNNVDVADDKEFWLVVSN
jgi:hypothetical protein